MGAAPDTSAYALATQDTEDLPNSRSIVAGNGIQIEDTGPGGNLTISVSGTVDALESLPISATGYVVKTGNGTLSTATISSPLNTIAIANENGLNGGTSFDVIPDTTIQQTIVSLNGSTQGTRPQINFIPGIGAGVAVNDNPSTNSVDVIISSAHEATNVGYIIQKPNQSLPSAQALSLLSTGILKNTTATGQLTIATANVDYVAPTAPLLNLANLTPSMGSLLVGSSTTSGTYELLQSGQDGYVLMSSVSNVSWSPITQGNLTAKYVLQTPDSTLPNAQALSLLDTGILKVTTATGALSTAIAGTDYIAPTKALNSIGELVVTNGQMIYGNEEGGFSALPIGTEGQFLKIQTGVPVWSEPGYDLLAPYIIQTADANLPNAQVLGALSTGLLKVTGSTGVLSSAVNGVDYIAPNPTLSSLYSPLPPQGSIPIGYNSTSGAYTHLPVGSSGQILTVVGGSPQWQTPSTSGAPAASKYILQQPDPLLTNAQSLSSLSTGLLKVTNGTGVLSGAVAGTDFIAPNPPLTSLSATPASGTIPIGNGLAYSNLSPGSAGSTLTIQSGSPAFTFPIRKGAYFSQTLTNVNIPVGSPAPLFTIDTSGYALNGINYFIINLQFSGTISWGGPTGNTFTVYFRSSPTGSYNLSECIWNYAAASGAAGGTTNANVSFQTVLMNSQVTNPTAIYLNQSLSGGNAATWTTVTFRAQLMGFAAN